MAVKFTEEQLNNFDKDMLIKLLIDSQQQQEDLTKEIRELNKKLELLMEQIVLANNHRFGRKTEVISDPNQICFMEINGEIVFFNEAEAVCDFSADEPDDLELRPKRGTKTKGKKAADISGLPINVIEHYIPSEELDAKYGTNGWKRLPDSVIKKYKFIPAKVEIDEHHVRNEKDEKFKKSELKFIADYLEPKRKEFKGTSYNGLCDDVFFAFNKCNIRHNNDAQIKMKKSDRMKMYDDTFKMCLILVQVQEVTKYAEKVKGLKESS